MKRKTTKVLALSAVILFATIGPAFTGDVTPPPVALPGPTVNDVTGMNPVPVAGVVRIDSVPQLRDVVRSHPGPISVGGGRYSMAGQIGAEHSLHLDTRGLDRIISIDQSGKTITVEAGATWRKIQEALDPLDLSVKIMQSYANFTVGGSLSVNAHGRYTGRRVPR